MFENISYSYTCYYTLIKQQFYDGLLRIILLKKIHEKKL